MGAPSHFTFTKWYLDCTAAGGRALIAYWAELAWHQLAITWQSVTLFEPDGTRVHRSSLARAPAPLPGGDAIAWPTTLGRIEVVRRLPPVEAHLHEGTDGNVNWRAEAPAASITAGFPALGSISGPGYVERIVMTVPPWQLPIRELRWGRWIDDGASRSVVWIDWRGSAPRSWVFVDGCRGSDPVVEDTRVSAGTTRLEIGDRITLHSHSLGEIVGTIPPLRAVVPATLLAMRQARWCSAASRTEAGGGCVAGRAMHEVVVFG